MTRSPVTTGRTMAHAARGHADERLPFAGGPEVELLNLERLALLEEHRRGHGTSPRGLARVPDSRIQVAVEKIDNQVDGHEEDRDEQDGALRHRVVSLVDGPEHEPPDAGEREPLLDDDRTAQQDTRLEPDHR